MKSALQDNERIIRQGAANLQRGAEIVGGKLYLTNSRIVFEPHAINFQSGVDGIDTDNVEFVRMGWTKLFGVVPIVPNSLLIGTKDGREFSFMVFGRKAWMDAITSAGASAD